MRACLPSTDASDENTDEYVHARANAARSAGLGHKQYWERIKQAEKAGTLTPKQQDDRKARAEKHKQRRADARNVHKDIASGKLDAKSSEAIKLLNQNARHKKSKKACETRSRDVHEKHRCRPS